MYVYRPAHLTEAHADALANSLVERAQRFSSTRSYHKLCPDGLRQPLHVMCAHSGERLLGKRGTSLERHCRETWAHRYRQQVPRAELIRAIVPMKETLRFVSWHNVPNCSAEACGEIELVNLVEQSFDGAICCALAPSAEARLAEQARASSC